MLEIDERESAEIRTRQTLLSLEILLPVTNFTSGSRVGAASLDVLKSDGGEVTERGAIDLAEVLIKGRNN